MKSRVLFAIAVWLIPLSSPAGAADADPGAPVRSAPVRRDAQLSREVLAEVNAARANPRAYAQVLIEYRNQFNADIVVRPGKINVRTAEGTPAVDEAIRFLLRQAPVPVLEHDPFLDAVAMDHVIDQGPAGTVGHWGSDGWSFAERAKRRGGPPYGGENISYGYDTAREVVIQLIVDDNVRDRGHRINMFRTGYQRVGVGCGPHARYDHMCVIDFGY